jgi:hypothetical protein
LWQQQQPQTKRRKLSTKDGNKMKGETDSIDKCKCVQMKTKLRTGSYCFLATLAFQEAKKQKQEGNN